MTEKAHRDMYDITKLRDAAAVTRYHTKRTMREQTNGQHSFDMLTLVLSVYPGCRRELLVAIIYHDLPELITGDTPGPAKRASAALATALGHMETRTGILYNNTFDLTEDERAILKWADRMESVLWCLEEFRMGNDYVRSAIRATTARIVSADVPSGCEMITKQIVGMLFSLVIGVADPDEMDTAI